MIQIATRITPRVGRSTRLFVKAFQPSPRPAFQPSNLLSLKSGTHVFKSPAALFQRRGVIHDLGELLAYLGNRVAVLTDPFIMEKGYIAAIQDSIRTNQGHVHCEPLQGKECSYQEANRLIEALSQQPFDYLIGMGGGKVQDLARIVSYQLGVPHVLIPTIASTDAPATAVAVVYSPDGAFQEYHHVPTCPAAIILDTEILVRAPIRYLISGLGDAVSTYYEARMVRNNAKAHNLFGARPTIASWAIACACRETLFRCAETALEDARAGRCTEALDRILEANTLLSGIGAAAGGLAAAHALHNGLTTIKACEEKTMHGERVAFCTVVQLVLERDFDEAKRVAVFNARVGLPSTLEMLHLDSTDHVTLRRVAERACDPNDSMTNMSMEVSVDGVMEAMLAASNLGQEALREVAA